MGWALHPTDGMVWFEGIDFDDEAGGICECGVVDDLDHRGYCRTCAAAPHGRECHCPACEAYWHDLAETSAKAAADWNARRAANSHSGGGGI